MEMLHYPDLAALSSAAAEAVAGALRAAAGARGEFLLTLSGGGTPRGLYETLAAGVYRALPWDRVHFFWSDERCVPPDHADSNYRLAEEALLSRLAIRPDQIHRLPGELEPGAGAARAEQELREFFAGREQRDGFPVLDLILLGVGPDGHTASLFPGRPALEEEERWVVAEEQPGRPPLVPRLTVTLPVLNAAREVIFLVSGEEKRPVVAHPENFPAGRVRGDKVVWMVDEGARG
jgi:6-phosphogluconolactonase